MIKPMKIERTTVMLPEELMRRVRAKATEYETTITDYFIKSTLNQLEADGDFEAREAVTHDRRKE